MNSEYLIKNESVLKYLKNNNFEIFIFWTFSENAKWTNKMKVNKQNESICKWLKNNNFEQFLFLKYFQKTRRAGSNDI